MPIDHDRDDQIKPATRGRRHEEIAGEGRRLAAHIMPIAVESQIYLTTAGRALRYHIARIDGTGVAEARAVTEAFQLHILITVPRRTDPVLYVVFVVIPEVLDHLHALLRQISGGHLILRGQRAEQAFAGDYQRSGDGDHEDGDGDEGLDQGEATIAKLKIEN